MIHVRVCCSDACRQNEIRGAEIHDAITFKGINQSQSMDGGILTRYLIAGELNRDTTCLDGLQIMSYSLCDLAVLNGRAQDMLESRVRV